MVLGEVDEHSLAIALLRRHDWTNFFIFFVRPTACAHVTDVCTLLFAGGAARIADGMADVVAIAVEWIGAVEWRDEHRRHVPGIVTGDVDRTEDRLPGEEAAIAGEVGLRRRRYADTVLALTGWTVGAVGDILRCARGIGDGTRRSPGRRIRRTRAYSSTLCNRARIAADGTVVVTRGIHCTFPGARRRPCACLR